MLVIVSDLHLTDGSNALNPHGSSFELLGREVAAIASDRKDGKDQVADIELVLLGDVFDLVRTDYWQELAPKARPWNGALSPETGMNEDDAANAAHFREALERILAQEPAGVFGDVVRSLSERTQKDVRVHYVVGNHDRALHNYPELRARIADFLGVDVEFGARLADERYGVLARHGHEWDPHCHGWRLARLLQQRMLGRFDPDAYRVIGIGEVVTAELMSGLVHHARVQLDEARAGDRDFLRALREVNNLRPMTDVIEWMTWLTEKRSRKYLGIAQRAFRDALAATLDSEVAKRWDRLKADLIVAGDLTDLLAKARWLLERRNGLEALQRLVGALETAQSAWWRAGGGRERDELSRGALEEFRETLSPATQYVVYGHTHQARQDYFSATRDHRVRMYINSGTFMPVIQKAADNRSFATSHRLTFVCFFRREEDRHDRRDDGPTVEVWDGVKRKLYV